jgi:hypothetical protein
VTAKNCYETNGHIRKGNAHAHMWGISHARFTSIDTSDSQSGKIQGSYVKVNPNKYETIAMAEATSAAEAAQASWVR